MPAALFGFRGGDHPRIAFGGAGFLIAVRVPSNPIGWILLLAGAGTALQELALQYLLYGMYDSPGAAPVPTSPLGSSSGSGSRTWRRLRS